jgi:hypothetical protein
VADRVELVIVAARAAHGEPQERSAERVRSVDHVLDAILLVDDAVLGAAPVQPTERGREPLILGRLRLQVARKLPGAELVVRHVLVERANDPVAPGIQESLIFVVEVAVGIREPRRVEPIRGHAFAIGRPREQSIHERVVRARRRVGDERVDFRERRRQAGQRERKAIDQRLAIRLGRRREAFGREPREHEPVDRVDGRGAEGRRRRLGFRGRNERPVRLVLRAPLYPAREQLDVGRRQREMRARRRHHDVGIVRRDSLDQLAARRVARHDRELSRRVRQLSDRRFAQVEPKPGFARVRIRTVAPEAVVRQDRANVPVVVDRARLARFVRVARAEQRAR